MLRTQGIPMASGPLWREHNSHTYIAARDLGWYKGLMRIEGPVHHGAFAHALSLPGDPFFHFLYFPSLILLIPGVSIWISCDSMIP